MKRFTAALFLTTTVLAFLPVPLVAQTQTRPQNQARAGAAGAAQPERRSETADGRYVEDAETIRNAFQDVLNKYPRNVGRVLRLDPALFNDAAYLASYPAIAQFVAQYPEVARSPEYYLQNYGAAYGEYPRDPRTQGLDMMRSFIEGLTVFLVIIAIGGTVLWLAKALVDHRRWLRVSKIQTEVHTKLLDRFSSSEELLAYMRTPAGTRFLESAPIAVDAGSVRPVSAPVNRIMWSVQAGVVLLLAGASFFVARNYTTFEEPKQMLSIMGTFGMFIGVGFIVSALMSYVLSKRLGLLDGTPAGPVPSVSSTRIDSAGL